MMEVFYSNPLRNEIKITLWKLCTEQNDQNASQLLILISQRLPQLMARHLVQIKDMLNELAFIRDEDHRKLWYEDILTFILFPNRVTEDEEGQGLINHNGPTLLCHTRYANKTGFEIKKCNEHIGNLQTESFDSCSRVLN